MRAFVEVKYVDDGASLAGAPCGRLNRSDVIEVDAEDALSACKIAEEKMNTYTTRSTGSRFIRWC